MSFLNKAKAAAQDAANKAQKGVEDVQVQRDLKTAYGDLGRKVQALEGRHPSG